MKKFCWSCSGRGDPQNFFIFQYKKFKFVYHINPRQLTKAKGFVKHTLKAKKVIGPSSPHWTRPTKESVFLGY